MTAIGSPRRRGLAVRAFLRAHLACLDGDGGETHVVEQRQLDRVNLRGGPPPLAGEPDVLGRVEQPWGQRDLMVAEFLALGELL